MTDPYRTLHNREPLVAVLESLVHQVSRLAWAKEVEIIGGEYVFEEYSCHVCGSELVPVEEDSCCACTTPKKTHTG